VDYAPLKAILFSDWLERVHQDGMFETEDSSPKSACDHTEKVCKTDPENWFISKKNAEEFIDALNFGELLSLPEIEKILEKNKTPKMPWK
jgi:hypothetical protein